MTVTSFHVNTSICIHKIILAAQRIRKIILQYAKYLLTTHNNLIPILNVIQMFIHFNFRMIEKKLEEYD